MRFARLNNHQLQKPDPLLTTNKEPEVVQLWSYGVIQNGNHQN